MTTLYVAGPMRGIPSFNYPAFHDAANRLRAEGFHVISPAELDVDYGDLPGFALDVPESFTAEHYHVAIRRDLNAVLNDVDGLATLDGWHNSKGATAEVFVARTIGLPVRRVSHWLKPSRPA